MTVENRTRISIDLLDTRQVMRATGSERAITFGNYTLGDIYPTLIADMQALEGLIHNPGLENFRRSVDRIGNDLYHEIVLKDGKINDLYSRCTRRQQNLLPLDLSISFTMDKQFIELPIEFIRDRDPIPVAARIPIYKTIITNGDLYPRKRELDPRGINVLLVSSNTYWRSNETIIVGDLEKQIGFTLPAVDELDNGTNEIDEIKKVMDTAKRQGRWNVTADVYHSDKLDYDTFLNLVASDKYHIIHYNGHGYFDRTNPYNSSVFFWEEKNKQGKVIALDSN
jgi:hypothetical protein